GRRVPARAEGEHLDALPVHGNLELVRLFHLSAGEQTQELYLKRVLAVLRKRVLDGCTASGAEGEAFYMFVLRQIRAQAEGLCSRGRFPDAEREAADQSRRIEIPLEQCRRHLQDAGNVVEAVTLIVSRHESGRVDVDRQQIA